MDPMNYRLERRVSVLIPFLVEITVMRDTSLVASISRPKVKRPRQKMLLSECQESVTKLARDCETAELEWLLAGPYDDCPARIVLTAGAGGTEANDWVADLTRMYTRYCYKHHPDWSCKMIDWVTAEGPGYKSVKDGYNGQ